MRQPMNWFRAALVGAIAPGIVLVTGGGMAAPAAPSPMSLAHQHNEDSGPGQEGGSRGVFQRIADFLGNQGDRGPGRTGGSRGRGLCLVTPLPGATLWSLEPMLVGEGAVARVALRAAGEEELLWELATDPDPSRRFQVVYDGPPLEPGEQYEWVVDYRDWRNLLQRRSLPFQILPPGPSRDEVTMILLSLEAEPDLTPAALALAQTDIFLTYGLLGDALQQAFSEGDLSPGEETTRDTLFQDLCQRRWDDPTIPAPPPPRGPLEQR